MNQSRYYLQGELLVYGTSREQYEKRMTAVKGRLAEKKRLTVMETKSNSVLL